MSSNTSDKTPKDNGTSLAKRLALARRNLREAELAILEIEAQASASVDDEVAPGKDNTSGASGADTSTRGGAPAPVVEDATAHAESTGALSTATVKESVSKEAPTTPASKVAPKSTEKTNAAAHPQSTAAPSTAAVETSVSKEAPTTPASKVAPKSTEKTNATAHPQSTAAPSTAAVEKSVSEEAATASAPKVAPKPSAKKKERKAPDTATASKLAPEDSNVKKDLTKSGHGQETDMEVDVEVHAGNKEAPAGAPTPDESAPAPAEAATVDTQVNDAVTLEDDDEIVVVLEENNTDVAGTHSSTAGAGVTNVESGVESDDDIEVTSGPTVVKVKSSAAKKEAGDASDEKDEEEEDELEDPDEDGEPEIQPHAQIAEVSSSGGDLSSRDFAGRCYRMGATAASIPAADWYLYTRLAAAIAIFEDANKFSAGERRLPSGAGSGPIRNWASRRRMPEKLDDAPEDNYIDGLIEMYLEIRDTPVCRVMQMHGRYGLVGIARALMQARAIEPDADDLDFITREFILLLEAMRSDILGINHGLDFSGTAADLSEQVDAPMAAASATALAARTAATKESPPRTPSPPPRATRKRRDDGDDGDGTSPKAKKSKVSSPAKTAAKVSRASSRGSPAKVGSKGRA